MPGTTGLVGEHARRTLEVKRGIEVESLSCSEIKTVARDGYRFFYVCGDGYRGGKRLIFSATLKVSGEDIAGVYEIVDPETVEPFADLGQRSS